MKVNLYLRWVCSLSEYAEAMKSTASYTPSEYCRSGKILKGSSSCTLRDRMEWKHDSDNKYFAINGILSIAFRE